MKVRRGAMVVPGTDTEEGRELITEVFCFVAYCVKTLGGELPSKAEDLDFRGLANRLGEVQDSIEALRKQNATIQDAFNELGRRLDKAQARVRELESQLGRGA